MNILFQLKESTSLVEIDGFICKPQYAKTREEDSIFLSIKDISKIIRFKMQLQKD